MRTKSKWFTKGRDRGPEQAASVVAVTAWKLGLATIASMRKAQFDIDTGAHFFSFLREYLAFLAHVCDRMAYARLGPEARVGFTTYLVRRLGELLAENESELVAGHPDEIRRGFVDLFNARGEDYAHFEFDDKDGPDFAFLRFLGNQLLDIMPPKDRSWVIDQIMAIEAPGAVRTLRGVFSNLAATAAPAEPSG